MFFLLLLPWETLYRSQYSTHLSCPAVSHICRLVFSPSTSILFIWKSTPANQKKAALNVWNQECISVWLNVMCLLWHPPSVVWMSPRNSLSVSLSRKLDFPAPASPAKTRRYMGPGSSVSSMPVSKGFVENADKRLRRDDAMELALLGATDTAASDFTSDICNRQRLY